MVYDDALPDPLAYRAACLAQPFESVSFGSTVFQGIALPYDDRFHKFLQRQGRTPALSFLRRSPSGQAEPHFVHSDADMGNWTAIVYLNPDPPSTDGTKFWRHRATEMRSGDVVADVDGHDLTRWDCWATVRAAFNRCVVFQSSLFHSRAMVENYGDGQSARLIQVAFGTE